MLRHSFAIDSQIATGNRPTTIGRISPVVSQMINIAVTRSPSHRLPSISLGRPASRGSLALHGVPSISGIGFPSSCAWARPVRALLRANARNQYSAVARTIRDTLSSRDRPRWCLWPPEPPHDPQHQQDDDQNEAEKACGESESHDEGLVRLHQASCSPSFFIRTALSRRAFESRSRWPRWCARAAT